MKTLLHIKSSSNPDGITRQIGPLVASRFRAQHPGLTVVERDLVRDPVPHVGPDFLTGGAESLALSDRLIDELFASDVVVIEAPMYNFSVPSVLKAWIDHVARARKTFRYTDTGVEGLLKGRKAVLVLSSGGVYSDGPAKPMEHLESYLRAVLGFIGITDIETIRTEGMALGPDRAAIAVAQAQEQARGQRSQAA